MNGEKVGRTMAVALLLLVLGLSPPSVVSAEAKAYRIVRTGVYALRTDLLVAILAKEMCTCRNVNRIGEGRSLEDAVGICLERSQLPITPGLILRFTGIEVREDQTEFEVDRTFLGRIVALFTGRNALVRYDANTPEFGCRFIG